ALSSGSDSVVRLWELDSRRESRSCAGQWGAVSSVTFLPNSSQFLFACANGTLQLRDAKNMDQVREFKGHAGRVNCVAVSRDSRFVLSGGVDRTMRLWNVVEGKLLHTFTEHRLPVMTV